VAVDRQREVPLPAVVAAQRVQGLGVDGVVEDEIEVQHLDAAMIGDRVKDRPTE
jgi:hypothetical protein